MRRIWVVGSSGSGKSTCARAISERTGLPWVQLDAVFHQPNWTPLPAPEFRGRVQAVVARDSWVIDGNYTEVADLVVARADTVVWLDLPRPVVMRQIILRTLRRIATREELWNGNRERWRNFFSLDEEQSVIVWSWNRHAKYRMRYQDLQDRPDLCEVRFVRIRTRRAADDFLAGLG
jgi:adenylate kinase family enzyme